jgi:hypothetical protein
VCSRDPVDADQILIRQSLVPPPDARILGFHGAHAIAYVRLLISECKTDMGSKNEPSLPPYEWIWSTWADYGYLLQQSRHARPNN